MFFINCEKKVQIPYIWRLSLNTLRAQKNVGNKSLKEKNKFLSYNLYINLILVYYYYIKA